ncbi:MAG: hypothetical protein JWN86_1846 [Planctomycetota bacterium]|nr:hypothetical protein [Planctomycetota bacterium]
MATVTPNTDAMSSAFVEPEGLYEIIDGRIVEKPPMGSYEFELVSIFQSLLSPFARARGLGRVLTEMMFDLRPAVDRQRRPDVAFVSAAACPLHLRAPKAAAWAVVPELAIEIVSPTNQANDVLAKVEEYFRAGSLAVWVVYPDLAKVYVYASPTSVRVLAPGDDLDGGAILPGFRTPVADLFGPAAEQA